MSDDYDIRQNLDEIDAFIGMMRVRKVNKYLEIGSRFGGSLWRVAKSLPKPSFVASVDKPADKKGRALLDECIGRIRRELGHQTQLYVGNSRKPSIISSVAALGRMDAIFIDADHSIEGVTADWANYGKMAPLIAFHDIAWRPRDDGNWKGIEVPALWGILKRRYPSTHAEFIAEGSRKGIGVIWGHD